MFGKIEYKLLIENYMTKDEYKQLIEEYMDKYTISYANAIQLIMSKLLIAYKQKISEEWLEKKNNESKNESDDETSEDPVVKKLFKNFKD